MSGVSHPKSVCFQDMLISSVLKALQNMQSESGIFLELKKKSSLSAV